jgi:polyphenol oxidase
MNSPSWQLKSSDGVEYFQYSPDSRLLLAFFTRNGGASHDHYESLNTSFAVGDDPRNVKENLARARHALGLPTVVTVKQTHSDKVLAIADEKIPSDTLEGDACITDRTGFGLGLKVADCLPVYIYAAYSNCIGIAHCGWRGTAARLAEKTARQMSRRFHVPLSDLRFALGPCICPNCYVVGDDVFRVFSKSFPLPDKFFTPVAEITAVRSSPLATYHLDIRAANRWLLDEVGLLETNSIERCTFEDEKLFYSARRDKITGRNLAVIALR